MYNLHQEPGHQELFAEVVHVDLREYQIGSPHYERLMAQMELQQRFEQPEQFKVNL